jgi:hypothetical protein
MITDEVKTVSIIESLVQDLREETQAFGIPAPNDIWIHRFIEVTQIWTKLATSIVAAKVNPEEANVIIVTRNEHNQYRVNRFFMIDGNWHTSVDSQGTADEVIVGLVGMTDFDEKEEN